MRKNIHKKNPGSCFLPFYFEIMVIGIYGKEKETENQV